jgi:hypothetical protein
MTLHELLVLREKIREQQATLAKLEQAVAQSQQVVDATTLTLAEATEQVAATQQRLNELYALRDQLAAAQDEVQAAENEVAVRNDQLVELLADLADDLRGLIGEAKQAGLRDQDFSQLQKIINEFVSANQERQLETIQDLMDELTRVTQLVSGQLSPSLEQIKKRVTQIEAARQARDMSVSRVAQARARMAEINAAANQIPAVEAELREAQTRVTALTRRLQQEQQTVHALQTRAKNLRDEIDKLMTTFNQELDALFSHLDTDVPLALLPVRLETRFVSGDLLIRIYPDDIHQDTHERELTDEEKRWGEHFWQEVDKASDKRQQRLAVWQQLAGRFSPGRAAWIARATTPGNAAPDRRAGTWTRAPHTTVLPDRWQAIGYRNGQKVFAEWGDLIPDPLPIGHSPQMVPGADGIDDGMRWMVDFQEAVKVGMGIRIQGFSQELDLLVVLGVRGTLDANDSASRLYHLLEAHHYTSGLGLVALGTPTNNTTEARAGFAARDPGYEKSFSTEQESDLSMPGDGGDADLAAAALGLAQPSPFLFAHAANAGIHDGQDARHMQTALWPATWGYYFSQMMADTFSGVDPVAWKRYCLEQVQAAGPLPTLRIADQPYGLLPVTALSRWEPRDQPAEIMLPSVKVSLLDVLDRLRKIWRQCLEAVPYYNRITGKDGEIDGDKNLVEMLGMDPLSSRYFCRSALGPVLTENLWIFADRPLNQSWWTTHTTLSSQLLNKLGLAVGKPLLTSTSFATEDTLFSGPLVQDEPLSEMGGLHDNYIKWLRFASPQQIHDQQYPDGSSPKALLYRLLRHATLQAYADAALQLVPPPQPLQEPELVDLANLADRDPHLEGRTRTSWRHLHDSPPFSQNLDEQLVKLLKQDSAFDSPPVAELRSFLGSMEALSVLPSATLARLLSGCLDLSTHRLDAWITSCATWRMGRMRSAKPDGIQLGGYGWVEHLQPGGASPVSEGYIHAPSLTQAATAAVLRSGYLTHRDSGNGDILALDLSSKRVRVALWLLEGVRDGQPLGALLGYRFERGLHERRLELNQYIPRFRQLAPLVAGKLTSLKEPVESVEANNVVDGLALLRRWQKGNSSEPKVWDKTTIPFGTSDFPSSGLDYEALVAELHILEDATDAVSDILMAESVYQAMQGNPLRAGASLDGLSRGEVPPQDLGVVRTARSGKSLTHRLLVLFSGKADASVSGTNHWSEQPRAKAEPHLNAWAARLFGDAERVHCWIEYYDPQDPQVLLYRRSMNLAELHFCPLDMLYTFPVTEQAQRSDLEQWIAYVALQIRNLPPSPGNIPVDAMVKLVFKLEAGERPVHVSFPELLEVAQTARNLIASGRPIEPRDLALPNQQVEYAPLLEDLQRRVEDALNAMETACADLRSLFALDAADRTALSSSPFQLPDNVATSLTNLLDLPRDVNLVKATTALDLPSRTELDTLRKKLVQLARFGIPGAVPLSPAGNADTDRDALVMQVRLVAEAANERLQQARARGFETDQQCQASLEALFGSGFRVLPQFTLTDNTLAHAFKIREEMKDAGPDQTIPWFQRIARVREGAARLDAALMYAETLEAGDNSNFHVAQLPLPDDGKDRWVALDTQDLPGGRISLVAHTPFQLDSLAALGGLVIDEWVETVPSTAETTGVSFHYDAPGACAPQALLLAVPPVLNKAWDLETLEAVVLETLEMAKLRAVDADTLAEYGGVGHYLPALLFAYNAGGDPNGDTVATNFRA